MVRREVPKVGEDDLRAAMLRAVTCSYNFEGMQWVTTYWDQANGRAFCLYEAASAQEMWDHAERARVPCEEVTEVTVIGPDDLLLSSETAASAQ
jgi:hypothetical protein